MIPYHQRQGCQALQTLRVELRYQGFRGGRVLVRVSRGLQVGHLVFLYQIPQQHTRVLQFNTSLCDLSKSQTSTALKVDVVAVHERAERRERFAGEEICLRSLYADTLAHVSILDLLFIPCIHSRGS